MAIATDALLKVQAQMLGAETVERGLKGIENAGKSASVGIKGLAGATLGALGPLQSLLPIASGASLLTLATNALNAADEMNDLSQKTGISVESLSRFKKAASVSGTSLEEVSKASIKLSKGLAEAAATGKGPVAESLKTLGISATDASGKLKSADEIGRAHV